MDGLLREFQDLCSSLKYSQQDIDDIKATQTLDKNFLKDLDNKVTQLKAAPDQSSALLERLDYLDNQSRRNNILIDGITSDHAEESWAETENKVREMLTTKLKLDANTIQIERAHRMGKFKTDLSRPRTVVVKLLRYKDKERILEKARVHLRSTSIYINEDFSERLRKKRAELMSAMRKERAKGNDRLIVRPKKDSGRRP